MLISQLKSALPAIETVIPRALRKTAGEYAAPCPKCGGTDRFVIDSARQRFWCRQCSWTGDILDLHAHLEGTDLKGLAKKHGLNGTPLNGKGRKADRVPLQDTPTNEATESLTPEKEAYFKKRHAKSLKTPFPKAAIEYMRKRGVLKTFNLLREQGLIGWDSKYQGFLLPIQNWRQKRILGLQILPIDGRPKHFVKGSRAKPGFIMIGNREYMAGGQRLVLAEGALDAMSIFESWPEFAAAAILSANFIDKLRDLTREFVLFPDRDEAGQNSAQKLAGVPKAALVDWSIVPADFKGKDANDLLRAGRADLICELIANAQPIGGAINVQSKWPEPVSLDLPELPPFTEEDFPAGLWEMISAVSQATETPPELAGMLALSVVATACQKKLEVEPEPGYREPLNIWTNTALPPATRKSTNIKKLTAPLSDWEISTAREMEAAIKEASRMRAAEESRLKELEKRFAKEDDPEKRQKLSNEMNNLEREMTQVPQVPRLWVQDVTPERLATLLENHGERLGVFSAEGGIFGIMAGRYSNGQPNLDIFLQAHSGDPVRVDRGSRPSVYLQAPALTMGLATQPDVLKDMAASKGFLGRGLIGRFLYALPPSPLGQRTLQPNPVPVKIENAYQRTVLALLNLQIEPGINDKPPAIFFSSRAWREWKDFALWIEQELADGGEFEHCRDWAGKLPGAAARIAGLFHCFAHAFGRPQAHQVDVDTMSRALSLCAKLTRHALAVYDMMGADPEVESARKVLKWITRTGAESFTVRDCHYALQGTFRKKAELEPALQILEERHYIMRTDEPIGGKAGRPSEKYAVNPAVRGGK